jgi:hypothetical protein
MLAHRIDMELPAYTLVVVLVLFQAASIWATLWVERNARQFIALPATLIFLIYTCIPSLSAYMAMKSVVQGFTEAYFFAFLGVYNFAGGYLRWASDICDDAALDGEDEPWYTRFREEVTKGRMVVWIVLLLDFVLEELLGQVAGLHEFNLLGPPIHTRLKGATLVEYRTVSFAVGLVGAWSQTSLLELLQRRSVLLRLLGARKTIFVGLNLLLMGAFAMVNQRASLEFLRESSPNPYWCLFILWIRKHGIILAGAMPIIWFFLGPSQLADKASPGVLVSVTLLIGMALGSAITFSMHKLWLAKSKDLDTVYRVIHLFPKLSSNAREKAMGAMQTTFKKGKQAAENAAVEWAAGRAFRAGIGWLIKSRV